MKKELGISPEASMLLFLVGAFLIIIGLFLAFLGTVPAEKVEGGGLIIIGPFPIIFGGEISSIAFLLVLVLPILVFLGYLLYVFYLIRRRLEDQREED